jgi:hypothetical protein
VAKNTHDPFIYMATFLGITSGKLFNFRPLK